MERRAKEVLQWTGLLVKRGDAEGGEERDERGETEEERERVTEHELWGLTERNSLVCTHFQYSHTNSCTGQHKSRGEIKSY